jgi:hypothetical protein
LNYVSLPQAQGVNGLRCYWHLIQDTPSFKHWLLKYSPSRNTHLAYSVSVIILLILLLYIDWPFSTYSLYLLSLSRMVISFNPYNGLRNMKNHSQLTRGNESLLKMVRIPRREREAWNYVVVNSMQRQKMW